MHVLNVLYIKYIIPKAPGSTFIIYIYNITYTYIKILNHYNIGTIKQLKSLKTAALYLIYKLSTYGQENNKIIIA